MFNNSFTGIIRIKSFDIWKKIITSEQSLTMKTEIRELLEKNFTDTCNKNYEIYYKFMEQFLLCIKNS